MEGDKKIIMVVSGGLVQDIIGIPPGTVVEVRDYDTGDSDIDLLECDDDGFNYVSSEWEGSRD